jgi:hypothetical protein
LSRTYVPNFSRSSFDAHLSSPYGQYALQPSSRAHRTLPKRSVVTSWPFDFTSFPFQYVSNAGLLHVN